ncbi:MAG TPA: hypothetical protein PKU94_03270 [Candidatus Hydrothermia bacterium]|nr:hypothetical protein [Candidatus Hydrothermia bacterium]HOP32381.1 hypothetical protein [Candidatus Hydrothermia bacterium]HRD23084.1 hypothetical protein [Candidatus Hydrothermia bacterium]
MASHLIEIFEDEKLVEVFTKVLSMESIFNIFNEIFHNLGVLNYAKFVR